MQNLKKVISNDWKCRGEITTSPLYYGNCVTDFKQ